VTTNRAIRAAITDPLREITGLHVYDYPVDNVQVPAAVLYDLEHTVATFNAGRTTTAEVVVLVSHNDTAQMARLDDLLDMDDAGSVVSALEDVTNADGVSLSVRSIGTFGLRVIADTPYYGATVSLQVWT
jgi:hypothetical protein